jgi:alpha-beta hydrolase superfamily lysophospholipase
VRTYPDARHEILNEINNAEVIAEIGSWADRVLASAGLS